ncbi:MAG: hypothetical protein HND52_02580 [Ignavibacteriae bacterium]|nr:hypothetical protein [Ignavibacteriota bacterium]NOG96836.1 hypothetical protein [Ignavibacteriota bacterium]
MGLRQQLRFEYKEDDLTKLLKDIGYVKSGLLFIKKENNFEVELGIEPYGLYIHRSGNYFEEFGFLIESLGNITTEIGIVDQ